MTAVAERIEQEPEDRTGTALTPMDMVNRAVSSGATIEVVEKLMALHERWEANQARKAFDSALSAAKAEIPVIFKNRTVDFTSSKGRTNYRHEDLGEIARTVDPILAKHGLSYRFRPTQESGNVTVTCILSHRDGYSEESALSAGRDESGNKNNIQAVGSTATYLQRYTLKMALGLAASTDDDGRAAGADAGLAINDQQRAKIDALITEVGADLDKFLTYFKVEYLAELPASQYERAVASLEAKRAKQ